jgi:hypothetical protein
MDKVERTFWSVAIFLGIHFIWLGGLERLVPLWIGTALAVSLVLSFLILAPRLWPYEKGE